MMWQRWTPVLVLALAPASAAAQSALLEQLRTADLQLGSVGYRLAVANAKLCDRLEPGTGMILHTLDQYGPANRNEARAHFKFKSEVAVEGVVAGSPAARAGLRQDDSLLRVGRVRFGGVQMGRAESTDKLIEAHGSIAELPPHEQMEISASRGGAEIKVTIQPVPACRTRFELSIDSDYIAKADGEMVQISVKFFEDYGENGVAAVAAHELAHNILRHRERLKARGVDYGLLAGFGDNVKYFRQTELEADLLSVSLLANAGYDPTIAVRFWRRFGPSRGNFLRSRSHPAWQDRVATMEREIGEVVQRSVRPYKPLILAVRARPLDGDWEALLIKAKPN